MSNQSEDLRGNNPGLKTAARRGLSEMGGQLIPIACRTPTALTPRAISKALSRSPYGNPMVDLSRWDLPSLAVVPGASAVDSVSVPSRPPLWKGSKRTPALSLFRMQEYLYRASRTHSQRDVRPKEKVLLALQLILEENSIRSTMRITRSADYRAHLYLDCGAKQSQFANGHPPIHSAYACVQ